MPAYTPSTPDGLAGQLASTITALPAAHPVRVGLDAPRCADLNNILARVTDRLERSGRQVALVRAEDFYRDASVRLEYGRTDVESFYSGWLDSAALAREVLTPAVSEHPQYLPSLRNPGNNRSTRAVPVPLAANGVVLITGELLLGAGLAFDLSVYFSVSRQARRRLTAPDWAWTLPAWDRYEIEVDPAACAALVVRFDDPARPAVASSTRG
ncbi:hypothetical protein M6D93_06910 [Jatrophihabitans telluris]|uniref:Uridine kinase n=1 Tax=Jatrophihabitans telluris TaxID=2038343 RepID=A0ABY4R1D2_9ACTN|nr:hypothetical protein [Jatrophihabitans telluris]UQX89726.1 hypothetical protein M6D93_06910 [Jatrophihabitans telluris]